MLARCGPLLPRGALVLPGACSYPRRAFFWGARMPDYADFVRRKFQHAPGAGIDDPVAYEMFPHQRALTAWALRRGKAAIFAETGLGKSRMQGQRFPAIVSAADRNDVCSAGNTGEAR